MTKNQIKQLPLWLIVAIGVASYLFDEFSQNTQQSSQRTTTVKKNERYYQEKMCNQLGGVMEKRLFDNARVDCLTDEYAIEVDFAKKWAEGIGQSLYYAKMTGKKPAVGLIIDLNKEQQFLKRLSKVSQEQGIKIILIEK